VVEIGAVELVDHAPTSGLAPSQAKVWVGIRVPVRVLLPKDGGKTFAANVITLSHIEEPWLGMVNRNALIVALEPCFFRVQIFRDELAFAKYCQGQWPSEAMDQVVEEMKRGLN
jgi:hypothetical protein